jgi:tRNA(Ile)-lysidine synthase
VLKQFQDHIARHRLCKATDKILLAVSGGLDSMVMLHLFHTVGFSISVAHCNFQLRGEESESDERFVQDWCARLKVPIYCKQFDTNNYAWENGLSIQIAARELRYAWFDELLKAEKLDRLATAHHLNDSLETVLLNLSRGTGIEGLAGIPLENKYVIRPMLFASRAEIEAYAKTEGIGWREDSSNFTDDYQRNFLRHHVIPKLKEINPSLEHTFFNTLEKVRGGVELMNEGYRQLRSRFVIQKEGKTFIGKSAFQSFQYPASVLWEMVKSFGFNLEQCEEIIQSLSGQSGKRFLAPGHQLVIDRESLIISARQDFWEQVEIQVAQAEAVLGPWRLEIKKSEPIPTAGLSEAILDLDCLQFPLLWRKWKAGDSFCPLGMSHHKKISDFLIDQKISMADKDLVTVLESSGEIIWVVGHRVDNRYKITSHTKQALTFQITMQIDS